ncbi:MAG: septum formation initiator family protein [bacterium]
MKAGKNRRKTTAQKWRKRLKWGALLVFVLYFSFGGHYNLYKYWKLKRKKQELQAHIEQLQHEKQELLRKIELLKNDKAYIEKIAREKYKMSKPGEKIYLIEEKDDK